MNKSVDLSETGALICAPELLFDKAKLDAQVQAVIQTATPDAVRGQVAQILSAQNQHGRSVIEDALGAEPFQSPRAIASYSYLKDQLITYAFEFVSMVLHPLVESPRKDRISIVAVGGYGRREMAPYSDIDILFLTLSKMTPRVENLVESMLYILWDIRLKVGHSTRRASDCIQLGKTDQTITTALMHFRHFFFLPRLYSIIKTRL